MPPITLPVIDTFLPPAYYLPCCRQAQGSAKDFTPIQVLRQPQEFTHLIKPAAAGQTLILYEKTFKPHKPEMERAGRIP